MGSLSENRREQCDRLFDLLQLERINPQKILGLSALIARAKASMSAEDISHVEALVASQEDD